MIDRSLFTPNGDDPPFAVPLDDICTVPTQAMAYLLADCIGDAKDVLEIGTGSGYQCAILAERCRTVISIDVKHQAGVEDRLPANVAIAIANAYEFDTGEQFDAVLVTFGASGVSPLWAKQVSEGGRLVVPIRCGIPQSLSRVSIYEKRDGNLHLREVVCYANFTQGES